MKFEQSSADTASARTKILREFTYVTSITLVELCP